MYEQFYGLSARPFQLMPDPRLLFESRDHVRALSYLLYGLERCEGFVVITGDVGTGKTLLLQSLLLELSGRDQAIARVAMANLGADSVVPAVTAAFGLPYEGRGKLELLDALVRRLQSYQGEGALLIVDEAQACSVEALEELRALANLQAEGQALIQIALIGQTELRDLLAMPSMSHLRQRIVAAHHLQPLAADEVRGYIEHRLQRVAWNDDPQIDADLHPRIHDWSGGVPRRINMLMDRMLLYGFIEELHHLTLHDLNTVIDEFEQELGSHPLIWKDGDEAGANASAGNEPIAAGRLDALGERMRHMEDALRNAVGGKRMEELLAQHRIDIENRAVIDAELRLQCLEGAFADVKAELRQSQSQSPGQSQSQSDTGRTPQTRREARSANVDFIDQIRPGAGRDAYDAPTREEDDPVGMPDEEWIEDYAIRPSRLFFWRRRNNE